VSGRSYLSIGDVLTLLRQEFPDITISKIRFLESQGLVNPERTPSGYRKFYEHDVERLRWVLRQQREHFLPLKVIKDRLDDGTDGTDGTDGANGTDGATATDEPSGSNGSQAEGATADTPASGVSIEAIDARVHAADGAQSDQGESDPADEEAPTTSTTPPEPAKGPDATRRRPEPVLVGQAASSRGQGTPVSGSPRTGSAGPGLPGLEGAPDDPSSATGRSAPSMKEPADGRARRTAPERASGTAPSPAETTSPTQVGAARSGPASERASEEASEMPRSGGTASPTSPPGVGAGATPGGPSVDLTGASLTLAELAAASGLGEDVLGELCEYGLLTATQVGGADYFDEDGLAIANLAAGFARYGVEPRHLRLYKNTADREAGFIEQIVLPLVRQRNPEARQRAGRTADELTQLGQGLRSALLRGAIRDLLGG
jgi:DNA-binding transcriptional MerR regulator